MLAPWAHTCLCDWQREDPRTAAPILAEFATKKSSADHFDLDRALQGFLAHYQTWHAACRQSIAGCVQSRVARPSDCQ